jgi:hypothetical protein
MSNAEQQILAAECRALSWYLIRRPPGPYVTDKYCSAHLDGNILHSPDCDAFDSLLIRLARQHRFLIKMVDLYTALFFKRALLRRKLVLLLAILESAPTTYAYFDAPDALTRFGFCLRTLRRGVVLAGMLLVSLVTLAPLHIGLRTRAGHDVSKVRNREHAPPVQ